MAEVPMTVVTTSGLTRRYSRSDSGSGTIYVWRNGVLVARTELTWYDAQAREGEVVDIAVFDAESDRPESAYPGYGTLGWDNPLVKGSPIAASYYRIDQYVASAWVERARVKDSGLTYYSWPTGVLADCETTIWRVVPVAASGAEGLALELRVLMVRRPDPPEGIYSLGGGGVVTVN